MWPFRRQAAPDDPSLEVVLGMSICDEALVFSIDGQAAEIWISSPPPELAAKDRERCTILGQWLAEGIAELDFNDVRVPLDSFYLAPRTDILALNLAPPSDVSMTLKAHSALHLPDFAFDLTVTDGAGRRVLNVEREGCYLVADGHRVLLQRSEYGLLRALETFGRRGVSERDHESQLATFTTIKSLAVEAGARLDSYLRKEDAYAPSQVALDLVVGKDGVLEVRPDLPGIAPEAADAALSGGHDVPRILTVEGADGSRQRILTDGPVQDGLRQIKKLRRLGGEARRAFLERPQDYLTAISIDLSDFGERVKAIGSYRLRYYPLLEKQESAWIPDRIGLVIASDDPDSEPVEITFEDLEEFAPLQRAYERAERTEQSGINWDRWELPIDGDTRRTLGAVHEALRVRADVRSRSDAESDQAPPKEEPAEAERTVLVIHTNLEEDEYREEVVDRDTEPAFTPPRGLKPNVRLLRHQVEGFAWLQGLYREGARGALLADDMGLGKTLQILAFLAWYAENAETPKPILVVAPVALLENWREEYGKFLDPVLGPPLELHGAGLSQFRLPGASGRELEGEGRRILDRDAIASHGFVLTTYEAVRDYQFSLAGIDWGVVVTDEAQKIKTPAALMTNAAKALKTEFRIAATGTPVENSLVDLWCLMDFAQPGLLGALKRFRDMYDLPRHKAGESSEASAGALRSHMGNSLLRRLKADILRDLPDRIEHELPIPMSETQARAYLDVVESYRARKKGKGQILQVLHDLRDLSVHPGLLGAAELRVAVSELSCESPKLAWVVDCLETVKAKGEKAILFTEDRRLQRLLASLIEDAFGLRPFIVNGEVPGAANTGVTRKRLIDAFQVRPGFNVIVMSPLAVGFGLNVTEANHVIHVTRLWNPAKEDQATDRTHRIGQTRDVHVYYPMAIDQFGRFATFDQSIAALLRRKRTLARNFLFPTEDLAIDLSELERQLLGESEAELRQIPAPEGLPGWARGLPAAPEWVWVGLSVLIDTGWATKELLEARTGVSRTLDHLGQFCRSNRASILFGVVLEGEGDEAILRVV